MARVNPPYFFDEFLRPHKRNQPTPRERLLGLTLKDLDWLNTLYYATDKARQNPTLRETPMKVEKLTLSQAGGVSVPVAGVFMMSPSPDENKAVLYTPYGGIEVFDSRESLLNSLTIDINRNPQDNDLLKFIAIRKRRSIVPGTALTLTPETIEGAVMEDHEQSIQASQQQNLRDMLDALRQIPSLQEMLDTLLGIMARADFPGLDQRDTRMDVYATDALDSAWIASMPLSQALLQFYVAQEWPTGQTRRFINPRHVTTDHNQTQARWHRLVEQTCGTFSALLDSLLQTYWNTEVSPHLSRLAFFAEVLSEAFRADLLLKRQAGIVSSQDSLRLQALISPGQITGTVHSNALRVEKVRLDAPYQPAVELAGTLMMGGSPAYLYTHSRGLQVLHDLDDLQATLLSLLKADGHQDEWLNFLSLDERAVFLGLDPVRVSGTPIDGDVFKTLAEDIMIKQSSNLEHALVLYRRSDGNIDPGALLDCALDVRSLLDPRLRALDAGGRWSLNPVSRQEGRLATVKAEHAKRALPRLQAIDAALMASFNNPPTLQALTAHALCRQFLAHHQRHLSDGMLAGLRSESELARLDNTLSLRAHDILDTVLNPESLVRLTRHGLNGFLPDAFGLTLKVGAAPSLLALANCFVLTERGGVDPRQSGQALLWTPGRGHEAFASLDHLRETLSQRLKHPDQRQYLLENLPASQCVPHQPYEPGPLQRIDENLLHNRLRSYADTVHDGIAHRLRMGLSAGALQGSLNDILRHAPPTNLTRTMALAQSIIHRQALPAWLGMAAPDEQLLHAQLLEQQRLSAVGGQDYLHGIVPLREHVNHTLTALLNARFPEQENNPDHVLIPTRLGLEGTAQTLTDFAMGHLPNLTADHIRPRSRSATPLPTGLDGHAVMQLVQQLGLKSFYQKWLDTHLDTQAVEQRQRCTLFCRQLPWQVLRHAHEEHLEERLSDAAWGFVRQIFDMPDAVARDAINGVTALIRPLELIATARAAVVRATGLYLIGPRPGEPGPQVLYTPYRARRVLQEYTDEADLLRELNSPGELQDWIALNLDAAHQATYRNLWREALHGSVPDIRLGSHPIAGSALLRLFDDNTTLLKRMFENQFEPLGRRQWEAVVRLLEKGAPGAVSFMAGKLEIPNVLWRSYSLFKDAAEHLQQRRWNEGLRAFIRGVAQLAALRKEADYFLPDTDAAPASTTISDWLKAPPPTAAHWGDIALTAPLRTRLQRFETHSVALNTLTKSLSIHVYTDNSTRQAYVPVAGKVYPVKRGGTRWCIHDGEQQGPCVQRNAEGKWVLDLDRHDPRFGKTLSRYVDRVNTHIAQRQTINIEAHGMREIAALSSWKARCINEALNVATYYAVTSKRNLVHYAGERDPASRLGRFFSELFGVHRVTPAQLIRIETSLDAVLNALVDPTLTRPDSMRFVTGTSRWSPEDTYAFTLPDDAEHKIYLVDRFFDPRMDIYQNRLTVPFDISAHARAATLIHELTHVTSQTEDIAYLDSMRPFHDLINTNVLGAAVLRTDLRVLRSTALSTLTPVDMLFKSWDAYAETWEDLGSHSLTRSARNTVLKLAGAKTLDEARHVFMSDEDKRIDIILANADSIAYLITQLGRELEAGA